MKKTTHPITLSLFAAAMTLALGCSTELDPDADDEDSDVWADEEIEAPTDTSDDAPEDGLQAAAVDSCSRSFDSAPGHGWYMSGFASVSYGRKNGVSWVYNTSYSLKNGHGFASSNNKIGMRWQVYSGGKWRTAADWMLWDDQLGTSDHSTYVGNGIVTNLPTRVQVRFSWDIRPGRDPAKTCTIRIS